VESGRSGIRLSRRDRPRSGLNGRTPIIPPFLYLSVVLFDASPIRELGSDAAAYEGNPLVQQFRKNPEKATCLEQIIWHNKEDYRSR
jgi:hypothetical protein